MTRPALSVVATLYKSAPYVAEFCARATTSAISFVGDNYEIILVNDGSPDNSLDIAVEIASANSRITVVDLSRNFGHHPAMMAGLAYATGDLIFLIDSDLEEEPEWLLLFAKAMREQVCDVVFGVQRSRKGGWLERWTGSWFYRIFNTLTAVDLPHNITSARLMTRRYLDALLLHEERELFLAGLWQITGFQQTPVLVNKHSKSPTTYTLRRKLSLLVNSITSFSNAPLYAIFYVGLAMSLLAAIYVAFVLLSWALDERPPEGWTSLIASVWLLGGLIISFLGVIGIYVAKLYAEAKRRPRTIVRNVFRRHESE
jgi:putative glycosyltransferase